MKNFTHENQISVKKHVWRHFWGEFVFSRKTLLTQKYFSNQSSTDASKLAEMFDWLMLRMFVICDCKKKTIFFNATLFFSGMDISKGHNTFLIEKWKTLLCVKNGDEIRFRKKPFLAKIIIDWFSCIYQNLCRPSSACDDNKSHCNRLEDDVNNSMKTTFIHKKQEIVVQSFSNSTV